MNNLIVFILAFVSFGLSRLVLWLINPDDLEGPNLLIVSGLALALFVLFMLAYHTLLKRRQSK